MTAVPPPVDWAAYADCPECGANKGEACFTSWLAGASKLNAPHKLRDTTAQPSLFAPTEETR